MSVILSVIAGFTFTMISMLMGWLLRDQKAQQSPQEIVGFIRQRDVAALKTLRRFYEAQPEGMTAEQALVLCDVCHQLGMSDGETAAVVGPFFVMMDG